MPMGNSVYEFNRKATYYLHLIVFKNHHFQPLLWRSELAYVSFLSEACTCGDLNDFFSSLDIYFFIFFFLFFLSWFQDQYILILNS